MNQKKNNPCIANAQEYNLISKQDVAAIKIKLGKSHRKESDWVVIKDILSSHNIIVMHPFRPDRRLSVKDHILCEDGYLVVFTNVDDCQKHIRDLNDMHGTPGRGFLIGTMPFTEAVDISEKHHADLFIDRQLRTNEKCMVYVPGAGIIKAVMIVNR